METLAYIYLAASYEDPHSPKVEWQGGDVSRALVAVGTAAMMSLGFIPAAEATVEKGDTCPAVHEVQLALRNAGFDPGPTDGVFGNRTMAAVIQFQAAKGLYTDGRVGWKTAAALGLGNNPNLSQWFLPRTDCSPVASSTPISPLPSNSPIPPATPISPLTPHPPASGNAIAPSTGITYDATKKNRTYVHKLPAETSDVVDVLPDCTEVRVVKDLSGWLAIRQGNNWVARKNLQPAGKYLSNCRVTSPDPRDIPSSPASINNPVSSGSSSGNTYQLARVATQRDPLRVRSAPNTRSRIMGILQKGEVVRVWSDPNQPGWVKLENGRWISSSYLEYFNQPLTTTTSVI